MIKNNQNGGVWGKFGSKSAGLNIPIDYQQ
jgi:hypothetical protein